MSTVSLRAKAYERSKEEIVVLKEEGKNLLEVVDSIVQDYLLTEKSKLILDIEGGKVQRKELDDLISDYVRKKNIVIKEADSYNKIIDAVNEYLWGYSVLNKYIDDLDISDVAVKGEYDTWIKKNGERILTDIQFPSVESVRKFAESISMKNKGHLSKKDALIVIGDSKTSKNFNLRINIGIDPVNSVSPHVVIRKIPKWHIKPDLDKLERLGMFNSELKEMVREAFQQGLNILIVGQGASGKSTLLNAGIECIPEYLSKLGIQEVEELSSGKKNWIWQSVVSKSGESEVEYDLQKLATNGLLLDLDWYIIGESKGAESMSLYDAAFTGHKVATSAHAPSSDKGIEKVLLNMKKSGTDYTRQELLKMLSVCFDAVIFMKKFKLAEYTEIAGYDEIKEELILNPRYKFKIEREDKSGIYGNFERLNDKCERIKNKLRGKIREVS